MFMNSNLAIWEFINCFDITKDKKWDVEGELIVEEGENKENEENKPLKKKTSYIIDKEIV